MKRLIKILLGTAILLTGPGACSDWNVDTDYLLNTWRQTAPAGNYEGVIPVWTFGKDYLYIQEGGIAQGSCIPAVYSYEVQGNTLDLLPPMMSSEHYPWDKPFKFKIQECTETYLQLRLLSIPDNISPAGLGPDVTIVKLERSDCIVGPMTCGE